MKKGFTLVEVLVAMLIFSVIMIVMVSVFVHSLSLQRRAFNLQQAEENASFVLEAIGKELRVAQITSPVTNSNCPASPETTLTVTHPDNGTIKYYKQGTDVIREVGGIRGIMNSNTVEFIRLGFCVSGSATGDSRQPRVTLLATIQSKNSDNRATVDMQITLSPRVLSN